MRKILNDLNYDFRNFTLTDFIRWLESSNQWAFHCEPAPLPPGIFGAWLTSSHQTEYILYDAEGSAFHRTHIILHELCHWLLGHPTRSIDGNDNNVVYMTSGVDDELLAAVRELEAETLCSLILDRVVRYQREQHRTTNHKKIRSFFNVLD